MTPRQAEVLEFIRIYQDEHGYSPAYTEIMAAMGWKSKSRVHAVLTALSDMGAIRVHFARARSVEIIPKPHEGNMQAQVLGAIKAFQGAGHMVPSAAELAVYLETSAKIVAGVLAAQRRRAGRAA